MSTPYYPKFLTATTPPLLASAPTRLNKYIFISAHIIHPEFLTATILKWQHLLKDDKCKQIIIDSLQWLTKQNRCKIYAFVIMPNHIHLLWKIADGFERTEVQGAFFSYTAHQFKKYLQHSDEPTLQSYFVRCR